MFYYIFDVCSFILKYCTGEVVTPIPLIVLSQDAPISNLVVVSPEKFIIFTPEPVEKKSKLWDTPNLLITPHVSSDDHGNYVKLTLDIFIKNLKLFVDNKELKNQVNKKLGY